MSMNGKVVLITGASGGIGGSCAEYFAEKGRYKNNFLSESLFKFYEFESTLRFGNVKKLY